MGLAYSHSANTQTWKALLGTALPTKGANWRLKFRWIRGNSTDGGDWTYIVSESSQTWLRIADTDHNGVCRFDFDGGGASVLTAFSNSDHALGVAQDYVFELVNGDFDFYRDGVFEGTFGNIGTGAGVGIDIVNFFMSGNGVGPAGGTFIDLQVELLDATGATVTDSWHWPNKDDSGNQLTDIGPNANHITIVDESTGDTPVTGTLVDAERITLADSEWIDTGGGESYSASAAVAALPAVAAAGLAGFAGSAAVASAGAVAAVGVAGLRGAVSFGALPAATAAGIADDTVVGGAVSLAAVPVATASGYARRADTVAVAAAAVASINGRARFSATAEVAALAALTAGGGRELEFRSGAVSLAAGADAAIAGLRHSSGTAATGAGARVLFNVQAQHFGAVAAAAQPLLQVVGFSGAPGIALRALTIPAQINRAVTVAGALGALTLPGSTGALTLQANL